jgi:glutaredoxin 3
MMIPALLLTLITPLESTDTRPDACVCQNAEKHTLVLYYSKNCPYSHKVLNYLKRTHREIPMKNVEEDKEAKRELLEKGGMLQVPCLLIDGQGLYDADAIIQWLKEHGST